MYNKVMNKVFLFDFDGTISDSMETLVKIFNEIVDVYHLPRKIRKDEVSHLRKLHLKQLIKDFGISPLKIPFILFSARKMFSKYIPEIKPVKEIQTTITELKKRKFTLGIISSNNTDNIRIFLKRNNLNVFDFIHSEQSLFGKDKVLKHVIEKYKLPINNSYYIGDELRDIEAAHKVGLKMIAVTWGANAKDVLSKESPEFLIDKPSDLLKID